MPASIRARRRRAQLAFIVLMAVTIAAGLLPRAAFGGGASACPGDCDGDLTTKVNELVVGVNIALGVVPIDTCPAFACDDAMQVSVNCLVRAVNAALNGCSAAPSPSIEGPITTGAGFPFVAGTAINLADFGYSEAEYFVAGTAAAYINVGPLTGDGMWTVEPTDTVAAYKTRILVYRPIDPARFNGTVLVEWLNVSGGLDAAPDWILGHTELIRQGYAYVGVSAQKVGIDGGDSLGIVSLPLKRVDRVRYGSLVHPGDTFSYDMFSQVARAIRRPSGIAPLGDLHPEALIASGDSQSAFRLVTYIDGIQPITNLFDGFLVHSRSAGAVPLSQSPQAQIVPPSPLFIRTDLTVPVLTFQTETDLTFLGSGLVRQPDTDRFRLWEVAGTAHADTYTLQVGRTDPGGNPDVADLVLITEVVPGQPCTAPLNAGPHHWVFKAAIAALNAWVRTGAAPPIAPYLELDPGPPVTIARDAHGNGRGGIRTPYVDAPIATFAGEQSGSVICRLFGSTTLFDAETLAALYPDHAAYVAAFNASADQAVAAGFLLPADAELLKAHAEQSDVGG